MSLPRTSLKFQLSRTAVAISNFSWNPPFYIFFDFWLTAHVTYRYLGIDAHIFRIAKTDTTPCLIWEQNLGIHKRYWSASCEDYHNLCVRFGSWQERGMNQPQLQRCIVWQTLPNLMLLATSNLTCRTKMIQTLFSAVLNSSVSFGPWMERCLKGARFIFFKLFRKHSLIRGRCLSAN